MAALKLPKHLQGKSKKEIMDFLANKVGYFHAMADMYRDARQQIEQGREVSFEDDDTVYRYDRENPVY